MTGVGLRVGQGFDVHPWSDDPSRRLVLGGVAFDGHPGLQGHSDADPIAHACTDALLGAAGLGDIGSFFPDTDPAFAGADSIALLAGAVAELAAAGWTPVNIDCTVICDAPKIAPHRDEMRRNLEGAVGAPVSVKGKRTEGLVSLSEGIQCFASALITATEPAGTATAAEPVGTTSEPATEPAGADAPVDPAGTEGSPS